MDIRSMNLEEMEALAISLGEKAFRGKQLFQWVHEKQADDFDEMTNLSAAFREKLKENYCISGVRQVEKQVSKKEDTAKYLFALEDDHVIESVWMKYRHGNSVCISSQVGCRMGCTFCASTLTGLTRNLTAGEMLSQIYQIQKDTKERVSNIIVMGMGEPLDNYEELLRFIKLVSCEKGIGISQRNITVSTCGLVDKIRMLADEKLQMTVYTTAPALQFYSGNYLGGTTAREHEEYSDWQGLALESEFLPDSPNHPEWPQPDCVLRPGEEYVSVTEYHFIPHS